jgi:hypothetical protein
VSKTAPEMSEKLSKIAIVRHNKNPFLHDMVLAYTTKQIRISNLGKDDNIILNQTTGEISGTHVVTYKKVDSEEFVKIFSRNIALTFNLNAAGIKAFNVLIWTIQQRAVERDIVTLDQYSVDDFLNSNSDAKLSLPTFHRGLSELEKSKIIAKSRRAGDYYINPNFVFNGNRIAFTSVIEKNTEEPKKKVQKKSD